MDILNLEELFNDNVSGEHKEDLVQILDEFKRGHYPNVLSKLKALRENNELHNVLVKKLWMVEAICHAEIGESRAASEIISKLYMDDDSDLMLLGELAFMCDYKLARRIMSAAVKQMEEEEETDRIKLARGFLVLAEVEEKLEKFVRSVKYFQKGLGYFEEGDNRDQYMILYIHFKIGMLYSMQNKGEESISYLNKVIEMAGNDNEELKIKSLVSIAKTYGSKDQNKQAYPYLEEALQLLQVSSLVNTIAHAEALTEMAYYYFDKSQLNEAVPYYQDAIERYNNLQFPSHRQLGMIHMQYAYCLEHKKGSSIQHAGINYEKAIERLELTKDRQLLENALADVIAFFDNTNNTKKKRYYENKFVEMANS
ncbi:Tetratricopeptide repeat-containing protein [Virgibacillus subterraneus]|uniref:Tetratricopeptide repeat-containing protein n=1 Tax=Virgibacillus subterraneus TaxID=621109 RepID=A0A1H9HR35_9BACI|nr:tetratricopeptide repeat protein [Virgibacillus subterraneus]SEQ64763.1 Tetratricopeptide repeat-containing protein [Virgibacillus subterraneus]